MADPINSRAYLKQALAQELPERIKIHPHPTVVTPLDMDTDAVLVIERVEVAKAPHGALSLRETFRLWLVTDGQDLAAVEDRLDDALDSLLEAIFRVGRAQFTTATRDLYTDTQPAYKLEITIPTTLPKETPTP